MALDYNDKSVEIQGWLIGYKEYGAWRTINLPGEKFLSEAIIEKILSNLNKKSDIVYSRKKWEYTKATITIQRKANL